MLDHARESEDKVLKRISTVDRHIIKVDKRLSELQGAMDKVLWVFAKHRLYSVRTQRKMARGRYGKTGIAIGTLLGAICSTLCARD